MATHSNYKQRGHTVSRLCDAEGDTAAMKAALTEFYSDLTSVLPIGHLIPCLYSKGIISSESVSELKALDGCERVGYFLDKVLIPGVRIGYTELFENLLGVMEVSDDGAVKYLAGKIRMFLSKDSTTSIIPSTAATPIDIGSYFIRPCCVAIIEHG